MCAGCGYPFGTAVAELAGTRRGRRGCWHLASGIQYLASGIWHSATQLQKLYTSLLTVSVYAPRDLFDLVWSWKDEFWSLTTVLWGLVAAE